MRGGGVGGKLLGRGVGGGGGGGGLFGVDWKKTNFHSSAMFDL